MNRILSLIAALLLIRSTAFADDPIRIGVLASLTGNWAEVGKNIQQGITLAGDEINATGGVLGRPLQFDFQDTDEEQSGQKVVTAYRHLTSLGIKLFIGPTGVPGILSLTPIAKNDDMLLVAPTSTNSFHKESEKFFNASGDNFLTTTAVAEHVMKQGITRVAIFGSDQPWEVQQAKTFKDHYSNLGGTVIREVAPSVAQTDLSTDVLRITAGQPQAVFFAVFNQLGQAAKAMKQYNFKGRQFASLLDDSRLVGSNEALEGTEFFLFDPPSPAFVTKYKARFGKDPGVFADSAYDAVVALSAGIAAAKSVEPAAIIPELLKVKIDGSGGKSVGFDKEGLIERGISLYTVRRSRIVRR